jgi:hypothetical protein
VLFIQPNVLDRACLSIGEHDGFARFNGIARPCQQSHLCCSRRLNGDACPDAHLLERWMVTALPIRGVGRFVYQNSPGVPALHAGTFVVFPRSLEQLIGCVWSLCQCGCASFGQESASIGIHPSRSSPACGHGWQFWTEPESAAFGYLQGRLFLNSGLQEEPLAILDMRRAVNRERRSIASKV